MTYRIARGTEVFGPYAAEEVYRLLATGNIVPTDLAQSEGIEEGRPGGGVVPTPPGGGGLAVADPSDPPWWLALLLGIVTGGLFFVIWDIVEAAWMRRVAARSAALALYVVV